jgi:hypothetical protein
VSPWIELFKPLFRAARENPVYLHDPATWPKIQIKLTQT